MDNIVDAVNNNSMNAIQQAILARILPNAKMNPVMGGVNQAKAPDVMDVATGGNAPLPQLLGAKGEISGRGGAMGGIGDALMNMYNSRIARSENEVRQAEDKAARLQKLEDGKQAIINEQNAILFKENTPAAKESREAIIANRVAQEANTRQIMEQRGMKMQGGGSGKSTQSQQAQHAANAFVTDADRAAVLQRAQDLTAKNSALSMDDALVSAANELTANKGLKGYQSSLVVKALTTGFPNSKASEKADAQIVKDASSEIAKLEHFKLTNDSYEFLPEEQKAAIEKKISSLKALSYDLSTGKKNNKQNTNTKGTTAPAQGQSTTTLNPPASAPQQPAAPTITYTGETDANGRRRVKDANGNLGWEQ